MSNFTFDDNLERRLEELRKIGESHAAAKKQLSILDHGRKILLAKLMKEKQVKSTGKLESVSAQEREARATVEYENYIEQLGQAIEEESKWAWQKEIVRINFEIWKTKMINSVVEKKHYG